jgi:ABC-type branched-subunit amino acid transport system ATPase component/ABC-type branched-subunit amino acid transport system permease subunit
VMNSRLDGAAKGGGLVALAVVAVLFPQVFTNPSVTNYGVLALIYVTCATSWNIFSGNTGYISLGQAVFYGSGAYAMGIAARDWHVEGDMVFALLPLSAAVGALIAVPFGLIALRVRRHTFIVVTIAVFFIFQLMAFNFWFTGGSSGLNSPFLSWPAASYNTPFYYIALAAWLVRRSRFGLQLRAIRDDEDRARGLGVKAMRVKLSAFVISGALTALIGAVWFYYLNQVQPQTGFNPLFDLTLVLMAFLGGYGSISGPVLGALIIEPLTLWLNTQPAFSGSVSEIVLGAVFLLVVLFLPRGVIPTSGRLRPPGQLRRCPVTALLRTDGIAKAYGGVQALDGATIEVAEGTVAGLIGPNGSGKTTLFNVITGYERPDAGEVWFGGQAITGYAPDKVFAAGIGRTFQLTRIFPRLTVLENMLIAAQARDRPRNLLAWFGRDAWTQHRRHALDLLEFVGIERHAALLAGSLSYGQRKLLELAYVLVADPAVVLLDEPAGGVNPTLINHIADRIRLLNTEQGKTFLLVEHNMEFVMGLCSTITVLESGSAVVSGPPDIVRTDKRVLDAYLGADLEEDDGEDS